MNSNFWITVATSVLFGGFAGATAQIVHQRLLRRSDKRDAVRAAVTELLLNDTYAQHNANVAEHAASHLVIPFRVGAVEHLLLGGHYKLPASLHSIGRQYLVSIDHISMMLAQARNPATQAIHEGLDASIQRYCRGLLSDDSDLGGISYPVARDEFLRAIRLRFKRWLPKSMFVPHSALHGAWVDRIINTYSGDSLSLSARVQRFAAGSSQASTPAGETVFFEFEVDIVNPGDQLYLVTSVNTSISGPDTVLLGDVQSSDLLIPDDPNQGQSVRVPVRVPAKERLFLRIQVHIQNRNKSGEFFAAHIWELLTPSTALISIITEDMQQRQTVRDFPIQLTSTLEGFVRRVIADWKKVPQYQSLLRLANSSRPVDLDFLM